MDRRVRDVSIHRLIFIVSESDGDGTAEDRIKTNQTGNPILFIEYSTTTTGEEIRSDSPQAQRGIPF